MSARGFVGKSIDLARKDISIEARGRETMPPMLAFALAVSLLLTFTLPGTSDLAAPLQLAAGTVRIADVLAGFLWVTVLFGGLIGFARGYEIEREEDAIDQLLLAPVDRTALFLGKAIANLAFVVGVELLLIPAFTILFDLSFGDTWPALLAVVALVDLGFVAVGTLFAGLAAGTRSRELLLPVLALPALIPIFIAAVELTSDIFVGQGFDAVAARGWFGILIAFDVILGTIAALTFEFAVD